MTLEELQEYLGVEIAREVIIMSFIISSLITIGLFLLKAVAIRTLAKNKGLDKLYLAFIPFFNYILLGKVIGTSYLFRKKVNNIGVLVTIASLTCFILKTLLELGYYVSEIGSLFGVTEIIYDNAFIANWMGQTGTFFTVIWYLYDFLSIIEIILTATIIFFIFRKYEPERAFIYSLISIFIDFMFGPLLFVIRNKKASTYDDFLRTRVVVMRPPNDNSYNQYDKNPENDPFPEFSNRKINENNSESGNGNNSSDDFFN